MAENAGSPSRALPDDVALAAAVAAAGQQDKKYDKQHQHHRQHNGIQHRLPENGQHMEAVENLDRAHTVSGAEQGEPVLPAAVDEVDGEWIQQHG